MTVFIPRNAFSPVYVMCLHTILLSLQKMTHIYIYCELEEREKERERSVMTGGITVRETQRKGDRHRRMDIC